MLETNLEILNKIKDNDNNYDEIIKILKKCVEGDITDVIATVRFDINDPSTYYDEVIKKKAILEDIIKKNEIGINNLRVAQVTTINEEMIKAIDDGILKGIEDEIYMLMRLPKNYDMEKVNDLLYEAKVRKLISVLLETELSEEIQADILKINRLIDRQCYFQVSSGSILGQNGPEAEELAKIMVGNGVIHFLSTNASSLEELEKRSLKEAESYLRENSQFAMNNVGTCMAPLLGGDLMNYIAPQFKKSKKKGLFNIIKYMDKFSF